MLYKKTKQKNKKSKLGVQVSLLFKISQHERDKELMKSFTDYLNCGNISKDTTYYLSS
jgi:LAGLIDADG endonuclease